MATLYYYKVKNYYNRSAKRYDTLQEYGDYVFMETASHLNFNMRDGVVATIVAGKVDNEYRAQADYVIYAEDNVNITSRWYIVEQDFNRKGQYIVSLYRDVLADNWEDIVNAPIYIEKATLPSNNPLIYNREELDVNQIKTSETQLKDKTGCPWIVGYFARRDGEGNITTMTGNINNDFTADIVLTTPISDWSYYTYTSNWFNEVPSSWSLNMYVWRIPLLVVAQVEYFMQSDGTVSKDWWWSGDSKGYQTKNNEVEPDISVIQPLWAGIKDAFSALVPSTGTATADYASTLAFENLNGKIIEDNLGQFYRITLTEGDVQNETADIEDSDDAYTLLDNTFQSYFNGPTTWGSPFELVRTYTRKKIVLSLIEDMNGYAYEITSARNHLLDQPYDMFCMPYGSITVIDDTSSTEVEVDGQLSLTTATEMMTKYGVGNSAYIYDVQLLPYCPLPQSMITDDAEITVSDAKQFGTIKDSNNDVVGYIFHCSNSSFTFDIEMQISVDNTKLENQCDMYRLVSPNFNGTFEFNLAKNGGMNAINVDCTYLPFNPYIHLNPDFHVLYGADFNDARGLICGGDFSLPAINSSWNQYQIQNKNFQAMFDREVQNMEVQRKYERTSDIVGAIVGSATGAAAGAMAGSAAGPIGMGVGAAVGGLASAAGGIADIAIKDALYNETLDYKRDMFNYSLGNIKALPQSIAKTTAFTYNNKLFPILEYYTCTEEEKVAVANKIAWNGMIVGAIGTINDYIDNIWSATVDGTTINDKGYIKGKIIQLTNINEDYHMAKAIADELNMGVYTKL